MHIAEAYDVGGAVVADKNTCVGHEEYVSRGTRVCVTDRRFTVLSPP